MPRTERIVIPGLAHHITQRGNYQQAVFVEEVDYLKYCSWMTQYAAVYDVDILAFCLMTNHVHFIAIPQQEDSLARTFNTVHMRHAQYMNKKRAVKGHLWQGRFFSCVLDEQHLYQAVRYVERNPVRANMVKRPWDYAWSSARWHVGIDNKSKIFLKDTAFMEQQVWKEYLCGEDEESAEEIRLKTQRGLVVGSKELISALEEKLKKSLVCLNPGRPVKQ